MLRFALVCEGPTDRAVLRNILAGYFGGDEEPILNALQPPDDATSAGAKDPPAHGGWGLVFKFFELGRHKEALQFNDYLLVQIDTDVSHLPGYDVPRRDGERDLDVPELVQRVIDRFEQLVGPDFWANHQDKLVFAIAVHSIECWLLPALEDGDLAGKTTNCLETANRARDRHNKSRLSNKDAPNKDVRSYQDASREYARRKRLLALAPKNPSLALFIRHLDEKSLRADQKSPPAD